VRLAFRIAIGDPFAAMADLAEAADVVDPSEEEW
jgi:hypothetical protein